MRANPNTLALALRSFLTEHLPHLRSMSSNTILSYRDSLLLLLRFMVVAKHKPAVRLDLKDFGSHEVIDFLHHLREVRGSTPSTSNVRLAAIHAFFRFVAGEYPEHLGRCQQILAVPFKRAHARPIEYFDYQEVQAILDAVDRTCPAGRRDYALLATMFNTGARVQEILDLRGSDLRLTKPLQARLVGKGRKERTCPLWTQTANLLRALLLESGCDPQSTDPIFRNHQGQPLTRFGVRYIVAKYCRLAGSKMPSLMKKRLHPHSMRHSTAMHLLRAGVDLVTISRWLGHASINTTNCYVTLDLKMKQEALAKMKPLTGRRLLGERWDSDRSLLNWLEKL